MARRTVLTSRQRSALFSLPQREADLLRHYTLSDEDLQHIGARRRSRNKLGFALQLCVLRYPGRLLTPGEFVPPAVVDFIIYWNTLKLGEAVFIRKNAGLDVPAEFLAHASPLGWEHINLTGEYRWPGAGPRST